MRRDVERIADLLGHEDRRHAFEVPQFDDLVVDSGGDDRAPDRSSGRRKGSELGFGATARAIATRRRCPPDISAGMRSMNSAEPDEAEHVLDTRARTWSAAQPISSYRR